MEMPSSSPFFPWKSLWIHPRPTLRAILQKDPRAYILWIAIFSGLLSGLNWLVTLVFNAPEHFSTHPISLGMLILIGGLLLGIVHLYFGGWLYQLTGSWIGGKGSYSDVKCAVGWANYPFIVVGCLALFYQFALQRANFGIQLILALVYILCGIWSFIIWLRLLAEAHQFSGWKALVSVLISGVILTAGFILMALMIPLLAPLFT